MYKYLAGEYKAEQNGDGELAVAEEYDVEQVWVGWVLQEKPDNKIILTFCSCFTILNYIIMVTVNVLTL